MALNPKILADSITLAFANPLNPTALIPAQGVSSAIGTYLMGGLTNIGGIPQPALLLPALTQQLATAWSVPSPTSVMCATITSTIIATTFMPIQILGGKNGIGGFTAGTLQLPVLKDGLILAFANPLQPTPVFGQLFATALDAFFKTGQTFSTGTPPDFVSSVGPLI